MLLRISATDSVILAIYIGLVMALGLWMGRGVMSLSRFLVAGRDLPWWAVLGSVIATETSAVTFLSVPGLAMAAGGDFGFLQLAGGFLLGRLLVVVWFMPSFFRDEIFTAYDVLKHRFGGLTQRTASGIFLITRTIADGLRLYLTALVLGQVADIDLTRCVLLIGVATIVYAAVGGIRGVIWNDCFQLLVYLAGAVAAIVVIALRLPDGLGGLLQFGEQTGRFTLVPTLGLDFSQRSLWGGLVGGMFLSLATHGADQMMVQRYLCARGLKQARWVVGLSGPLVLLQFALFLFVGVALAAWYQSSAVTPPVKADEALAHFIVEQMPVGLCGLTLAAVFSVAMSTLSSSLSGSASAIVNDFFKREVPPGPVQVGVVTQDRRLTWASRLWTAIFGSLQIGVAILVIHTPRLSAASVIDQVLAVAGIASGLILGVFLLGLTRRQFSQRSGLVGMLGGFLLTVLLVTPLQQLPWLDRWIAADRMPPPVHYWWSAAIASLSCCGIAWMLDWFFPRRPKKS